MLPDRQVQLASTSIPARLADNLAAVRLLKVLDEQDRVATPDEQLVLSRWTSWGALPQVFDETSSRFEQARAELKELLTPSEWAAAARTTINAHYTDVGYARAIWRALSVMGAGAGEVLEPGCGGGVFMGAAPASARVTGVELDPVTARITGHLYPSAVVRAESFASTPFADGTFDTVVGNVPFGKVALYDPRHNTGRHSIHNHFIIKGLHLLKPGGTLAVLTSRHTLDSLDESARREMYVVADLVAAVRLPTGAHLDAAGTDVVTDVVMFRRRMDGDTPADPSWLGTAQVDAAGSSAPVAVSRYFVEHPERVLGEHGVGHGMFGPNTYRVAGREGADVAADLSEVLTAAVRASGARHDAQAGPAVVSLPTSAAVAPEVGTREGTLVVTESGTVSAWRSGVLEPVHVPKAHVGEVRQLIGLRDLVVSLLTAEAASSEDTVATRDARRDLNYAYDAYVTSHGPIGRFTLARTGRVDEDGADVMRRMVPTAVRLMRSDPMFATVLALESFDPATMTATKAAIFTKRVVAPREIVTHAATAADALALSMDTTGGVDLGMIAALREITQEQARAELGTLVFDDPQAGRLVPAAEYLSGQVRAKLEAARDAAAEDPAFAVNVAALEPVIPQDLTPAEITATLGAVWISADDVTAFGREVLGDRSLRVTHLGGSEWSVTGNKHSVASTSTWGTERLDAVTMLKRMLKQQRVVVMDTLEDGDGRQIRVINPQETEAAGEKATALRERFEEWVWEDPARAHRLAKVYNETFNGSVLRTYDTEHLSMPGLALSFTPRPHQLAGVARMVAEPSVGLFHEVGAGKTATMVMGVQELRRLGMVRKPAIVVPNHMLEQFSREYLHLYPQASILAASIDDLAKEKRRAFVARIATGDWDAVIMTRTAFEALPVSAKAQKAYEDEQMAAVRAQLERARVDGGAGQTVKRLETMLLRAEERLKRNMDRRRDVGVTFEQTGIDYLCVDELHDYKNLTIVSNIEGVARAGSQRATDLDMKLHLLRAANGERVATGATATPIANSVSEAYVMQRYLRPDLLDSAGITDFDSWAATFGEQVTEVELAPEGAGKYRTTTRFVRFRNVPEMLKLWHLSADIKTAEDLKLPTPPLRERGDGTRAAEAVVIAPSLALRQFVERLGERAEDVRRGAVTPDEDNMLVITGEGRKAALDMRLVSTATAGHALVEVPTKIEVAAARIHRIWAEHRDRPFLDGDGQPSTAPGALQIVFCDLGTPSARWNAYDELKARLVDHGLDPARVRFVHEASKDSQKAELFAACRDGGVDVIVGSTPRMGVGTNIQRRAVALHHLDCPWRPADIAQREGRILRQGNQNPEIGIYRYVVEGSFDAYMWQTVERKAKFIAQVMRGRLDLREIEDIGDAALSFSEVKALASGDPRILEKAKADQDLVRLERLERAHHRSQAQLGFTVDQLTRQRHELHARVDTLTAVLPDVTPTAGEAFVMTVEGVRYTQRVDAMHALHSVLAPLRHRLDPVARPSILVPSMATLGGLPLDVRVGQGLGTTWATFTVAAASTEEVKVELATLGAPGHGPITRLENRVASIPGLIIDLRAAGERASSEIEQARASIGKPFPKADELAAARTRSENLTAALARTQALEEVKANLDALPAAGSQAPTVPGPRLREDAPQHHHTRQPQV